MDILKIGIAYDGNYFAHVNDYYYRFHERRARISIDGLHDLVRTMVSEKENADLERARVVDTSYFRGRMVSKDLKNRETAYFERSFEDNLIRLGVSMHLSPVKVDQEGKLLEKGVDVTLALEAFEKAMRGKFDVFVLIGGDGDYVPLARKLNALGVRVMVLGWRFNHGENYTTVSKDLMREVIYPVDMSELIDSKGNSQTIQKAVDQIFLRQAVQPEKQKFFEGVIDRVGPRGFGFIAYKDKDNKDILAFFHESELIGAKISDLRAGMRVTFEPETDLDRPQAKAVQIAKR